MTNPSSAAPKVTILIPNYRTFDITKLCLRLIRKHTDMSQINVIVIDNDSCDASTEYLRSLKWIRLIERKTDKDATPSASHSNAMDEAMAHVTTPYVLSMHTDSMVRRDDWLDLLLSEIERDPNIAGVGSWKLEEKSLWRRALKAIEESIQRVVFPLIGKKQGRIQGRGDNFYYLRSHCAMYRTGLFKKYDLKFAAGNCVAGKDIHRRLVENGHDMVFLSSEKLGRYMIHLNHATGALNPEIRKRKNLTTKDMRRINRYLQQLDADMILADDSLDRP
jgi:glycosyltransferase involved in cell wall biosynthesis